MIPENVYRELTQRGEEWSDKNGAADLLEYSLKSLKAQIILQAKDAENCSVALATEIALAAADYRDACKNYVEARTAANKARVRYDAAKALFEAQRTAEASHRAATRAAP